MNSTSRSVLLAVIVACLPATRAQTANGVPPSSATAAPHNAVVSPRLRSMELQGNVTDVIRQAFALYDINVVFAGPVQGPAKTLAVDLRDSNLYTTARILDAMTHCFFIPLTPGVVLAVPDDAEHRRDYEHFSTETIDVPNIDGNNPQEQAEVIGLLSAIFGVAGTTMHGSAVTVRARRRDLVQIEYTLSHLFLPKPQVMVEVKAYVVSVGHNRNVGIQTPQQITVFNVDSEAENLINSNASVVQQLIDSGTVSAGNTLGIAEALITGGYASNSVLSSPFVTFGGGETLFGVQTGAASANLSLTSTYSQQLQEVTLQLLNDQKGSMKIGERYPVMTSSTVNLGSSASTATPAIQYEDLGITLEAQPHIAANGEVLLHLHEVVRSLDGAVINSIPVLDNQEFVADLSVPAGATTVVVSNLSSTDTRTIQGLAALLPTNGARNRQNAELVITLTPVLTRANLAPQ